MLRFDTRYFVPSLWNRRRSSAVLAATLACVVVLAGCAQTPAPPPTTGGASVASASPIANVGHVFLIVMENKEYSDIIGSREAPYINSLARDYGLAERSYAITHPSLPNYLALLSGSTQGITTDCEDCSIDAPNLVDQLEAHRRTWRSYQEDLPSPCFNGPGSVGLLDRLRGLAYVRRHNPFAYFESIQGNPLRCRNIVPMTGFSNDLKSSFVPDFVWITPNLRHDMHDGSIAEGDSWLQSTVPDILASSAWKDGGVLIVTWDEGRTNVGCCGNAAGGHIPTIVAASSGKRGFASPVPITHYSVLRTIEEAWGLGLLGHAADQSTNTMFDYFS